MSIILVVKACIIFLQLKGVDDPFFVMNIDQVFKCFKLWTKLFPTIRPFFGKRANFYCTYNKAS